VDPARDATEIHLLKLAESAGLPVLAESAGLPVLAVCRGMQLVNAVRGGALVQHLKPPQDHWQQAPPHSAHHLVTAPAGSRLHRIPGCTAEVNSCHHQAVDQLGDGLAATAFCGPVVEAFESRDGSILGVQWHPEFLATRDPGRMGIFRGFV
jgi:putative glutamine amidotransferase